MPWSRVTPSPISAFFASRTVCFSSHQRMIDAMTAIAKAKKPDPHTVTMYSAVKSGTPTSFPSVYPFPSTASPGGFRPQGPSDRGKTKTLCRFDPTQRE